MKRDKINRWFFIIPIALVGLFLFFVLQESDTLDSQPEIDNRPVTLSVSEDQIPLILLAEANRLDIQVSEEVFNATVASLIDRSGLNEEGFYEYILQSHESREAFHEQLDSNLRILKLLDQEVDFTQIIVTDADVDRFLEENKEIAPVDQIENDPTFRTRFYELTKQQIEQNRRNQMIAAYVEELVARSNEN